MYTWRNEGGMSCWDCSLFFLCLACSPGTPCFRALRLYSNYHDFLIIFFTQIHMHCRFKVPYQWAISEEGWCGGHVRCLGNKQTCCLPEIGTPASHDSDCTRGAFSICSSYFGALPVNQSVCETTAGIPMVVKNMKQLSEEQSSL